MAPRHITMILGDCATGVDAMAREACETLGILKVIVRASYRTQGRRALSLRNTGILDIKPDEVWWFHDDLARSVGTRDCVQQALARGIPVRRMGGHAKAA